VSTRGRGISRIRTSVGRFRASQPRLRAILDALWSLPRTAEETRFLMYETQRLNEQLRSALAAEWLSYDDQAQTAESFDYQWRDLTHGAALPDDEAFMQAAPDLVCTMTGKPASWFPGRRVVDVGCGVGRFTHALLRLGAKVTACDQSGWALERTARLCAEYDSRLEVRQIDLLAWDETASYDLAFCYGVVHHTGNSYLAIRNVTRKVAEGGSVFLMVYGWPGSEEDARELNHYEALRRELRCMTLQERHRALERRFSPRLAHGYFDAVAPRINDLLTLEEVQELLQRLGFCDVRRTLASRNLHLAAERCVQVSS
jgi:2-polyprenyl-3-methyl-5-hydroxy-6-metoxy-1,4-benzoquinol methylase